MVPTAAAASHQRCRDSAPGAVEQAQDTRCQPELLGSGGRRVFDSLDVDRYADLVPDDLRAFHESIQDDPVVLAPHCRRRGKCGAPPRAGRLGEANGGE